MKNWILRNFRVLQIVLLLLIALPVLIIFWFWIWDRFLPTLDQNNAILFSNLATPIAAICSVVLFIGLTLRQINVSVSQSKTIYYQQEIERIKVKFLDVPKRTSLFGTRSTREVIDNIFDLELMTSNPHFIEDVNAIEQGHVENIVHYHQRLYSPVLLPFMPNLQFGIRHFHLLRRMSNDLRKDNLTKSDLRLIKRKVSDELIGDFVIYVGRMINKGPFDDSTKPNKIILIRPGEITVTTIDNTSIGKAYKDLFYFIE